MAQPIRTTDKDGTIEYKLNGRLHRVDGPAVIYLTGGELWCQNGIYHREDGPAINYPDGSEFWYRNGKRHRTDGPAIIWSDGVEDFWLNGEEVDIMVHFLQRK